MAEATCADAGDVAACIAALADEIVAAKGEDPLAWEQHASTDRIALQLASDRYRAFVARGGGNVLGVITISQAARSGVVAEGWIEECFVDTRWRGLGVGHELVRAAAGAAKEWGWRRVKVNCPPLLAFAGTRRFYEREGFRALDARTLVLEP